MGLIDNINKLFDHRIRLGIMSILMVNEYVDFNGLKELLQVTDGNLASHAKPWKKQNILKWKNRLSAKSRTPGMHYPFGSPGI